MTPSKRFLGITVMSPHYQHEGVEQVITNLVERAGVTAVATNTSVVAPAPEGVGHFDPPTDAGASVRLLDRPLWGQRGLWLQSGPGHHVRREFFADSPYQPRPDNELTTSQGHLIGEFISAAHEADLRVYIQTGATQAVGSARGRHAAPARWLVARGPHGSHRQPGESRHPRL